MIVPREKSLMIQFYLQRQSAWTTSATQIGITALEMQTMDQRISAAVDALAAQQAAKNAARSATLASDDAAEALREYGSDLILKIKAKAGQDGNNNAYVLAEIPPPDAPSPAPAPGTATDFVATILPFGFIQIGFKCTNPAQGTVYEVVRRLGATGAFDTIATVGEKKFVDDTIPAGTSQVTYGITSIRSTKKGVPALFTVQFGVDESGQMIATIGPETTGAKLAA